MPIEITMPRLSDTMESGTVIKWNVSEGDEVSAGDAIADIETDKATMEMQVYDDGRVAKLLVDEGKKVDVGTVIAVLAGNDEDVEEVASGAKPAAKEKADGEADEAETKEAKEEAVSNRKRPQPEKEKSADGKEKDEEEDESEREKRRGAFAAVPEDRADDEAEASRQSVSAAALSGSRVADSDQTALREDGRRRVSPVARRLAEEHDIDLRSIEGSGPQGRVVKRDVLEAIKRGPKPREAATEAPPAFALAEDRLEPGDQPLSGMRQTIARRLVESITTIPHYQVTFTFDMDPLLDLRQTLNEQLQSQGVKLSVSDFLVRACALAIHQHPEFNASWGEDRITVKPDVNIAVAVSLPRERGGGLVVAVIRNADRKGLRQISEETKKLAEKARTRGLTIEEMSDSTFTLSNLGMYGVEHFNAIINPPNCAILAVGAAKEKPVVRDGQVVIGRQMQATLSLDHRIIDGAMAAEYLQTLQKMIENPAALLV